jgi:hypothetical protein
MFQMNLKYQKSLMNLKYLLPEEPEVPEAPEHLKYQKT